jgi:LAS superfamily LD-carboxypeptidase LdcB
VPQDAFNKTKEDKAEFYAYITSELKPIDGQPKFLMNREAAEKFAEMRAAAKADGVPLIAMSTFRTLEHEEAAARAAGNPNAVGGISHLIGLAVDVQLHVSAKDPKDLGFGEASTTMPQMLSMLHSPVHKWIFMNGSKFGFYQYRQEPWHWEYNPPGFRERFYAKAPNLKEKAEEALAAARPKPRKK